MTFRRLILTLAVALTAACTGTDGVDRDNQGNVITGACYKGGCSNQLCSDQADVASTCEWRESYACYAEGTCERQADGACGFTQTAELVACLEAANGCDNHVVCAIACEHGMKQDAKGCFLCECLP